MNLKTLSLSLLLPLAALAVSPAQASPGQVRGESTLSLDQATAPQPRAVVRVDCDKAMWPTLRQVARHAATSKQDAQSVRHAIVVQGRRACAQGAAHVQVVFHDAVADSGDPSDNVALWVTPR